MSEIHVFVVFEVKCLTAEVKSNGFLLKTLNINKTLLIARQKNVCPL
jgi:hypothetical protein